MQWGVLAAALCNFIGAFYLTRDMRGARREEAMS